VLILKPSILALLLDKFMNQIQLKSFTVDYNGIIPYLETSFSFQIPSTHDIDFSFPRPEFICCIYWKGGSDEQ